MKNEDRILGGDFFIPMFLILAKTFFITWPFVSDEKYMKTFCNNLVEVSEEVFDKFN